MLLLNWCAAATAGVLLLLQHAAGAAGVAECWALSFGCVVLQDERLFQRGGDWSQLQIVTRTSKRARYSVCPSPSHSLSLSVPLTLFLSPCLSLSLCSSLSPCLSLSLCSSLSPCLSLSLCSSLSPCLSLSLFLALTMSHAHSLISPLLASLVASIIWALVSLPGCVASCKVIQEALRKGEDCHVQITNYRKCGEPFQNKLSMRPIHDSNGVYRFCIGVQTEVDTSPQVRGLCGAVAVGLCDAVWRGGSGAV